MKIGVNLWVWESPFRSDKHLDLFEKVRGMDAEVVEFAFEDGSVVETSAVRRALQDQALACSTIGLFGPLRDLSSEDPRIRRDGMDYARQMC